MPDNKELYASKRAHTTEKTILIVEDDTAIGSFLIEAIKQETAHRALLAIDGYQALRIVDDIKPGLFLIDYSLPYLNGLELYDQLHATKELENVPALMLSASCPWEEAKKRKIPCMRKPIELDELLQNIEKFII
jgi:DNA-binding response OmpR family regulator